jgi:hypothetical protein
MTALKMAGHLGSKFPGLLSSGRLIILKSPPRTYGRDSFEQVLASSDSNVCVSIYISIYVM